jgi:hypothetical protein
MNANRGFIVISPAGQMAWYAMEGDRCGEKAPVILDITGQEYTLFRCTLLGIMGLSYGHVAAVAPLNANDRERVAHEFFGPRPLGVIRFQRVAGESVEEFPH